ncbi:nuclear export mediator factor NEMF-like isoform X1 [Zingiber officinale]|uniref:nuclear export mediator factor NEMF-like isoform X1 n=1 Tax=Zingiber officinale TaxID=94328 RepID=UPI001C4BFC7B|nr:nuclear export mediator factor NEMF-like isoform X1 [Zingiber officinale]XP_042390964.1 nuclear export mediator factor NEMF-like isoform X1 [Zingiber officinale]
MVKVRMNTADVAGEVKCLRKLIGMRCANVYDISPKTYLFKMMNSSGITESGESEKVLLLMESGVRLHTTQYVRDKNITPSGFTLKLRRHIRTRRLEDVRQLGYDRIVLFQFGLGNNAHFVILELYAQGNILLTDSEFTVLTLLRSHRDDDKGLAIMSRHRYPIEACRVFERTNLMKLKSALACSDPANESNSSEAIDVVHDRSEDGGDGKSMTIPPSAQETNRKKQPNKTTLKSILGEALSYGPALSEHIILDAGLLPNVKVGENTNVKISDENFEILAQAVTRFEDWLEDVISGPTIPEGYILMQNKGTGKKEHVVTSELKVDKIYDEFCPLLLNQFKSRECIKFDAFDYALDEFYSKIESQRSEQQRKAKEESAMQKLDKIRLDQENRVHALKKEVDYSIRMAELIEYNLEDVDAAILAVRVALANGMSWEDLARMVKEERKSGNPVAGLIDKLYLDRNCITLLLSNNLDEMDDDEKTAPVEKVEVDLALSAHANARRWYELKKRQENKQDKTVKAHEKAFKAAEKKTKLQLAQEKTVAAISHMRKVHWFEKFNWFISSENYLVISGRDAQQNEMIVKRYMSKGDLYVHADLHGASSTVIKNHKPDNPIPPLTLNQAGCFTVCHSQAWDSKIVTSAWWVYPHQVSKTAPSGEYLTVGSFMIRGRKNFLPPHPLVMGFGIMFRLDESSLAPHLNERRVRGEEEGLLEMEVESHKEQDNSDSDEQDIDVEDTSKETENHFNPIRHQPNGDTDTITGFDSSIVTLTTEATSSNPPEVFSQDETGEGNFHAGRPSDIDDRIDTSGSSQLDLLIDKALGLKPAKLSSNNAVSDTHGSTIVESQTNEIKTSIGREKPYISKAERRKFKKGQKNTSDAAKGSDENENDTSPANSQLDDNQKVRPVNPKITRGQKGKLKKIKEKYAEQDEEERRIRMALLASSGKAPQKEKEPEKLVTFTGKLNKSLTDENNSSSKICFKCKKAGHLSKDCQEHNVEPKKTNVNVSGDSVNVLNKGNGEIDIAATEDDDIPEIGEEEREKLNDLDYFTGNPLPSDILLYAVPVCGPYNALQTYKYRVKITPGTAKKGKAAKTAMNLFSHTPEVTSREKELMKACTDPELFAAIISNVKITAPGLTQLKQRQKKGKRSGKDN